MDNNNMLKLCRLCLVKDDVNIPIFEEQGDIRQIFLKISSCLPVKVSRDDQLPKKICDGCSYKLDMLYEFWNTSANAEKQLLTWLGEAGMSSQMADGTISAVAQQIKPADAFVKQETIDPPDIHMDDDDDDDEEDKDYMKQEDNSNNVEEPPPKRARRTAAVKAAIALDQNSDDDDDSGEPMTKVEDDSEDSDNEDHEPAFVDVPSTSADDQPGPSGVGKDGVEAPSKTKTKRLKITKKQVKNERNDSDTVSDNDWFPDGANKKKRIYRKKSQDSPTELEKKKPVKKRKRNNEIEDTTFIKSEISFKSEDIDIEKSDLSKLFDSDDENDNKEEKPGKKKKRGRNIKLDLIKIEKFVNLNEVPEPVNCKQCGQTFQTHIDLGMHSICHSKDNLYTCHMCDFSKDKKSVFKNHIRSHDLWKCEKCGKIFKIKRCAYKHSKTHNAKSFVQCEICGKDVRNVYLDTHKKLVHADEKNIQIYKCHLCDKAYKNSTALKGHYSYNHKEYGVDTSVICDICGMRLSCKGKLGQHLRTHTGDRPFPCTICPRKFISKDILRAHMRVHTGEKPYVCMYCGKKFAHGAPYRYHIKTHTGERSFVCSVCGKGFISRANMRIHMKSCMFPVKLFNEYPLINK
ncbi:zinc finger protein 37-like isoform X11 [Diorhabda carinulata]|uniref:zinc finger protein 37-like isoform X11 n=1 Tax=Diorhabda carinulata TaxID=1163345 RepID=UPI0025A16798|nr:zinc finger protein 37-like isoform X11 [Diorhabda carinulata]